MQSILLGPVLLAIIASIFYAEAKELNLDRDVIRESILHYRAKRNTEGSHFSPRLLQRVKRQSLFPTDDEDNLLGSGDNDGYEPEPPTESLAMKSDAQWVWYRTKINFLDSIEYSEELTDYRTETFHSLSDKIMFSIEEHLKDTLAGYSEATPLMFSQRTNGEVDVLVDIGSCSWNSASDIEEAVVSLLRTGHIGDLNVSTEGFSIRELAKDPTRIECRVLPTTTTTFVNATGPPIFRTSVLNTTFRSENEPTPPNEFDGPVIRVPCAVDEATCRNGQCISRSLICNGIFDCTDGSDEPLSCNDESSCDPTEFLCPQTGVCAQKTWKCDGDDDCGDGYDERNCPTAPPGSNCPGMQMECPLDDLCVPISYLCDGEPDCSDGSDESGCSRPVVIKKPQRNVTVTAGETVILTCEATGLPTPVISWRLNWGNVGKPPRVSMTSVDGKGEIVIKHAEMLDQGAYSCEAINSLGSIFAVPDAILTVSPGEQGDCPLGEFGMEAESCRPCFCFGVTDQCEPLEMAYDQIEVTFEAAEDIGKVNLKPIEPEGPDSTAPVYEPINKHQIVVTPAARELQLIDLSKRFLAAAHYWSLPAQFLGAKINSYGGTLTFSFSYNNSYNFEPKPTNHSDVIIEGANGETLTYHHKGDHPEPGPKHTRNITLTEDNWTKPNGESASREEFLSVLNNIDKFMIRTVYDNSMLSTGLGDVRMTVASEGSIGSSNYGGSRGDSGGDDLDGENPNMAYAVEKCICPEGYSGLSCQYCEPGWMKIVDEPTRIVCKKIPEQQCPVGYEGRNCSNCALGYEKYDGVCLLIGANYFDCDPAGTSRANKRSCDCKDNVEGDKCHLCKSGYFNLNKDNPDGCTECFCMGITENCNTSFWSREKVVPQFSDGERFMLKNAGSERILNDVRVQRTFGRRTLRVNLAAQPRDVFYWVMPDIFEGDKITSYGGDLRYIIEFNQRDSARMIKSADVKIFGNDIALEYRADTQPSPGVPNSYDAKFIEDKWVHADGGPATRQDLMMALADLEEILIRASYSTGMLDTSIYDISLEVASPDIAAGRRAVEVEECVCPPGYSGTSCQDCADGYYRSSDGEFLGTCVKCSCNGHSDICDKDTGECTECRNFTTGQTCNRCIDGFYGDPRLGTPTDCKPCPCRMLPSSHDSVKVATCILDIDGLPTCNECPPGYSGRNCDSCQIGYTPVGLGELRVCEQVNSSCQCDVTGSVDGSCDEEGLCICKPSTTGPKCDVCKPSYFYFSVENTEGGCLPCFCMGVTRQCESSRYIRDTIDSDFNLGFAGFSVTNRQRSRHYDTGFEIIASGQLLSFPNLGSLPEDTYYWSLPTEYLGDKVVSYGGELSYTVQYVPSPSGVPVESQPDLIIVGNDITLMAYIDGEVAPRLPEERKVKFTSPYWTRGDGQTATREHLLMALADLESILIRASYSTKTISSTIGLVSMETASAREINGGDFAYEVENCTCPDGYEGLSCEDCSPGYTRESSGIYLGICKPCECNGRADDCNSETGDCIDCREHTKGPSCESCVDGYYSMSDDVNNLYCTPCACPGTGDNSFSKTCEYSLETRRLTCTACEEGYEGERCEFCAEGFEGNPRVSGGSCLPKLEPEPEFPPTVILSPSTLRVSVGKSAILNCVVQSNSPADITWRRTNGQPVTGVIERSPNGSVLAIGTFSKSDAGGYECIATNAGGSGRDSALISVAPKRDQMMVRIQEPTSRRLPAGSDVTFICTADSVMNNYIIYWSRTNGRLPRSRATEELNGILHIRDLRPEDSGDYVCTGSNMYDIDRKTANLVVYEDAPEEKKPTVVIEPAHRVVHEGEGAHFRCTADGSEPIRIEWTPSEGESFPTNARVIDGDLYLPSVSATDSAVFYCRAYNSRGFAEATAVLDVTVVRSAPVVTVATATTIQSVEGRTIEMRCIATGAPTPIFSWRRVEETSLPINSYQNGGTLVIRNVQGEDSDTYICTARNSYGQDSGAILLNVTAVGQVPKPVCKTDPEFTTVYIGADTYVTCIPKGDPLPTVTWVRSNGRPLPSNAKIEGNKLVIKGVTTDNAGKYICIATNPGGTTRSEMTIRVENKTLPMVVITPRTQLSVEIGESASFTCTPTSGLPANVTWSRTGRRILTSRTNLGDNGVITFTNVTMAESGTYLCTALNVVGFREFATLLTVTKKPKIMIEPTNDVYLRRGRSVTLRCNADGIPVPNVAWEKVHMFGGGRMMTHYKRQSSILTVRADDIGSHAQFMCIARSAAGDARAKVTITVGDRETVVPPEVVVKQTVVSTPLGQQAQLQCAATGYPSPKIDWSKYRSSLPTGSAMEEGILTIATVDEESAGIYVCEAENSAGRDTAEIFLKVVVPPKVSINSSDGVIRIAPGHSQTIKCSAIEGSEPITYQFRKVSGIMSRNIQSAGQTLQVNSFNPNTDPGTYSCIATNLAGSASSEVALLPLEIPNVALSDFKLSAIIGNDIQVSCSATEGADRVWSKTKANLQDPRISTSNGALRIQNIQLSDSGEYICTATNAAGSRHRSMTIVVQEPPSVSISLSKKPQSIREGSRLEITCTASGDPTPSVTLTKDDREVLNAENGHLIINVLQQSDAGTYACVAQSAAGNAHDEISISIKAPLMLSVIPDTNNIETRSGEDLAISCVVKGTDLSVTWTREGGELPESAALVDGTLLQIDSISTSDEGEYVCTANAEGQVLRRNIRVTVHAFIPFFSQSPRSYITMRSDQDLYSRFSITVSFKPSYDAGLILYSSGAVGEYISLLLRDGKVEFRYNVGSGDASIQSTGVVQISEWHTVTIKRDGRDGSMIVDDQDPVYGGAEGSFQNLNTNGVLYIGGYPYSTSSLPVPLRFLGMDVGFFGCISQLEFNGDIVDIGSSKRILHKEGVLECSTCRQNGQGSPCQHGSKCTESHYGQKGFTCACSEEYVGPECQFRREDICGDLGVCGSHGSCTPDYNRELGYRCECFPGYIGPVCQFTEDETLPPQSSDEIVSSESIIVGSDNVPEASSFSKGSYLALDVDHDDDTSFSAQMKVKLRSLDDGLILYNGNTLSKRKKRDTSSDVFTSIALLNRTLEFRYSCGEGSAVLRSDGPVMEVNRWYVVRAQRQERSGLLQVDGEVVANGAAPGKEGHAELENSLYIGGVRFWDNINQQVGVSIGMDGCVDEVYVNRNRKSLLARIETKNVEGCEQYEKAVDFTTTTQRPTSVDTKVQLDSLFLDSGMPTGFSGSSAKFNGKAFISFPQEVFPHDQPAEQISLHFKTHDVDGPLIMQGRSGGDYIVLGLQKGKLEYAFRLGSSHGKVVSRFSLSDGRWHNITVLRRNLLTMMWIDDRDRPVGGQAEGESPSNLRLGDLFIGGALDVPMYTGDRYRRGFRGCIKNVKLTTLTEDQVGMVGQTYYNDSRVAPLQFGSNQGRKAIKGVSKCRHDKSKTLLHRRL